MAFERTIGAGPGITAQIQADLGPIMRVIDALGIGRVADAADRSLFRSLKEIVDDLQAKKLSGSPAPVSSRGPIPRGGAYLAVRTGRGRGSMRAEIERKSDAIIGTFGSMRGLPGEPSVYMQAHEEGFTGTVQVRGHMRRGHPVRPHERFMDMPARRFIRAGLLEGRVRFQTNLVEDLNALVREAAGA